MSFIDYYRINKLDVKWNILVFITLSEVDGVWDRSVKYFTTFKIGQTLRFKMVGASIQISVSELVRNAEVLCTKEHSSALWLVVGHSESPKHC